MTLDKKSFYRNDLFIVYAASIFVLLLHLYSNAFACYGIFRDELYYIACANRLDIGYVDHPPFSIYVLAVWKLIFGDSVFAIRLVPAIASGITVFFTGLTIKKMGGGKLALLAGIIPVTLAPILLGMFTIFSMNSLSIMFWIISIYIALLIIQQPKPKYWILLGIMIGIGSLNKIDFTWFGLGFFISLIFTEQRKHLKTVWPYIMTAIAILIFLPFVIWNFQHDFAHLEFIRNATSNKYSGLTRIDFILNNILILNPFSIFIWLPGIYYYFFYKEGRLYRPLGIIFLTVFAILFINAHSKAEYLSVAFPCIFAAGGILLEKLSVKKYMRGFIYTVIGLIIISGLALAPITLTLLPVKTYISYSGFLGIKPSTPEGKKLSELPQFYADMFGWEEMAKSVANVYKMIPPEEREKTIFLATNYGEAGAIEYYKSKYDLPPAACFHNNCWIWAGDELKKDYQTFIVFGGRLENHLKSCEFAEQVYTHTAEYAIPYETNRPIFICKKLKRSPLEIRNAEKHYE
jgi:hypothetical protein